MSRVLPSFPDWPSVLDQVRRTGFIYYHAPMDVSPRKVAARVTGDDVRVSPVSGKSFDPFTADPGHLDRFKQG